MFMHRPMEVENVEIERMRLHMERDGKGEMNCWAALGMDAAAGEAASNHGGPRM